MSKVDMAICMYGNQDQRQLEYAGDQQGCSQDVCYDQVPIQYQQMPQPTNVMMDERWQPKCSNTNYATRGTARQIICQQPWVQQTRRMDRDDRYTPKNMEKTIVAPEFANNV